MLRLLKTPTQRRTKSNQGDKGENKGTLLLFGSNQMSLLVLIVKTL